MRTWVSKILEELRQLRNQIAHHEAIHDRDLDVSAGRALDLVGWMDPEARGWVTGRATALDGGETPTQAAESLDMGPTAAGGGRRRRAGAVHRRGRGIGSTGAASTERA